VLALVLVPGLVPELALALALAPELALVPELALGPELVQALAAVRAPVPGFPPRRHPARPTSRPARWPG
jgi:hypothetical protein